MALKASEHLPAWWPTFLQIKRLSNGHKLLKYVLGKAPLRAP